MGWTHCFDGRTKPNGSIDRRYECDRLLTWCRKDENGNVISSGEVLKSAMVGSTYYAAVRNQKGEVWAAVFLTCGRTKWDGTAWGYKDMDETMGPNEDKCPASILGRTSGGSAAARTSPRRRRTASGGTFRRMHPRE